MNVEKELQEAIRRKKLADYYYDNYRQCYLRKEYSKASEFIWGAVNMLTYALGLFYGMKLTRHEEVIKFLKMLANQYEEIREGITAVQSLHANYYHDFMSEELFEEYRVKAEKLLSKLAELVYEKINLYISPNN
ncbi:MAG: hypothetical protein NDF52_03440 [archaeon YNP-WB-062]|jgi:hypothetical protein|nr:hypothetical protein [Candidatus Culexarchaeum yellowstonense]MCS7366914.1 hypothetical protein [Candidatus Culexarchaeum yellowstonense]